MKTRKTVLLSAIAVLLCIYIFQLIRAGQTSVKKITLKGSPTVYTMKSAAGEAVLTSKDGKWIVGDKNYPADTNAASSISSSVKDIKVLDIVSRSAEEATLERYGLDAAQVITVTAADASGKVLRTMYIGKESSTGSQTYVKVDSSKDIYLVSGALKNTFGKKTDDLRSKEVYSVKTDDITHIAVTSDNGSWELDKSGTPAVWSVSAGDRSITLDTDKTNGYVGQIADLNVDSWLDDSQTLPAKATATAVLTAAGKQITVTIYTEGTGDKAKYYGTSSETPYKFTLAQYNANKYSKKLDDLKK